MKVTEEQYQVQQFAIEERYIKLAEELTEQLCECVDWDRSTKEIDAQSVIALWLKLNEPKCKEESCNYDKDVQGFDANYLQSKIDAHTKYMQEHGITSEQQLALLDEMRGVKSEIPVNPWHKTSEELPKMTHSTTGGDYSDLCVCINESGEHKILVLCEDSDYTYWAYGYDGEGLYDEEIDGEITHWMPIPELPKED